jgi:ATP-dependent helicase/nuclease subunit A
VRRRFVELPVLFRDDALDGSPLVEGKIDLLFEEDDGWVVVDWKTDRIPTAAARAEREALYAPQLASYARALAAVLGPGAIVKETVLAFARA